MAIWFSLVRMELAITNSPFEYLRVCNKDTVADQLNLVAETLREFPPSSPIVFC